VRKKKVWRESLMGSEKTVVWCGKQQNLNGAENSILVRQNIIILKKLLFSKNYSQNIIILKKYYSRNYKSQKIIILKIGLKY
jgi:hypothetical protein